MKKQFFNVPQEKFTQDPKPTSLQNSTQYRPVTTSQDTPLQQLQKGQPYPLGAHWNGIGVNFALFSASAEKVELCLFDDSGMQEIRRLEMPVCTDHVWHGYLPAAAPGLRYGYRVYGPYRPEEGLRFNPHKLLLDPYAFDIDRPVRGRADQHAYRVGSKEEDFAFDTVDNGASAPKAVVVNQRFEWGNDRAPDTPLIDSVFYEVHVKGFTQQNAQVPEKLRGTYAGLASDPSIAHLKSIGVTAVELLPVHAFVDDQRLLDHGLSNYWGYNTIGFFAPDRRYSASGNIAEFKAMVKTLHAAGIEVILDVVYNHTAEGNHLGPTLSFKGIDHPNYYRLSPEDRRFCVDYTGTGNTLDSSNPIVVRLILDSLRYWVQEMHVDGFRFDLASTLGRGVNDFDPRSPFLTAIAQDPVLSRVKLIAEPWDIGPTGYQVGGFPVGWSEWNGKYRDAMRDFWRGENGALPEFAARLAGSSDLYAAAGRAPTASVNVITVHDGFTLHDLVSYNKKHNQANKEGNRDGENHNRSWNCGHEGESRNPAILELRERQKRNLLTTLFVSQGTPLLLGGDEMNRSQRGNNNGYCQDNPLTWHDWRRTERQRSLVAYVKRLIEFRQHHPVLKRRTWLSGQPDPEGRTDVTWYNVWGLPMTQEEWTSASVRCVGVLLDGRCCDVQNDQGQKIVCDSVLLLINASHEKTTFTLPSVPGLKKPPLDWTPRIDSAKPDGVPAVCGSEGGEESQIKPWKSGEQHTLLAHSMVVLSQPCVS